MQKVSKDLRFKPGSVKSRRGTEWNRGQEGGGWAINVWLCARVRETEPRKNGQLSWQITNKTRKDHMYAEAHACDHASVTVKLCSIWRVPPDSRCRFRRLSWMRITLLSRSCTTGAKPSRVSGRRQSWTETGLGTVDWGQSVIMQTTFYKVVRLPAFAVISIQVHVNEPATLTSRRKNGWSSLRQTVAFASLTIFDQVSKRTVFHSTKQVSLQSPNPHSQRMEEKHIAALRLTRSPGFSHIPQASRATYQNASKILMRFSRSAIDKTTVFNAHVSFRFVFFPSGRSMHLLYNENGCAATTHAIRKW